MGSSIVVEVDPVAQRSACMLQAFEAMAMNALLLESSDDTLDHAVLLRAMGRDELLLQPIPANQSRVIPTREDKAIV